MEVIAFGVLEIAIAFSFLGTIVEERGIETILHSNSVAYRYTFFLGTPLSVELTRMFHMTTVKALHLERLELSSE